jgi:hypothetical protein
MHAHACTPAAWHRRLLLACAILAVVPVAYVAAQVYWDEFDSALDLLLGVNSGTSLPDLLHRLFAVTNEHRTVTSRTLFLMSYWLTGTVNFSVIGAIGDAFLLALCGLLIWTARTTARRIMLAVILAAMMFQLEHYENFLWSGSSIDHFQVVLLAGAALAAVAHGTRGSLMIGLICAVLATFTLAHGTMTWPIGALMLWRGGRRRALAAWCTMAVLALVLFFAGFHLNSAEPFAAVSPAGATKVFHYWLALLGAVPALGNDALAPWLGAALLGWLGWLGHRGAARTERFFYPLAWYGVASLALVAVGRAELSGGVVYSRYYVLGALAWSLVLFIAFEPMLAVPRLRVFATGLAGLAAFNLSADYLFAERAATWTECRDRAAVRFMQHRVDGRGPFPLYPDPVRSTHLLAEAERLGLYHLPPVCQSRSFRTTTPSNRITYYVDELTVSRHTAFVRGWAAIPGVTARRGQLHLVLRDHDQMRVFTTVAIPRPDVATAYHHPTWQRCGFVFAVPRDELPPDDFQIGFLVADHDRGEFIMTDHHLVLTGGGEALLASGQ